MNSMKKINHMALTAAVPGQQQPMATSRQRANLEEQDVLRTAEDARAAVRNQHQPACGRAGLALAGGKHLGPLAVEQPDRDGEHDGGRGLAVSGPDAAEQVHKAQHDMNASPASTMSQGARLGAAGVGAGVGGGVHGVGGGTGFRCRSVSTEPTTLGRPVAACQRSCAKLDAAGIALRDTGAPPDQRLPVGEWLPARGCR